MIHGAHRMKIYKKKRHIWTAFLTLFIPALILFIFGGVAHINFSELAMTLGMSFLRLVVAYAVALVLGLLLGIILGSHKWGENVLPVFDVFQNLPSFALIPLFALLFGYTSEMAIVFAATSIIWPIFFYTVSALRTARVDWNEAASIFGATGFKRIVHYLVPLSFPAIVTGSLVGISIGWEAIIGIELIGKLQGIGTFINTASNAHATGTVTAAIIAILALVFIINKALWSPLIKYTSHYAE